MGPVAAKVYLFSAGWFAPACAARGQPRSLLCATVGAYLFHGPSGRIQFSRLYAEQGYTLPMILHATHTHLYPGHRGTISALDVLSDLPSKRKCLVEFDDGSAANATITGNDGDWRLHTSSYRTAAGTDIPEKDWLVRIEQDAGKFRFRILRKLPATEAG